MVDTGYTVRNVPRYWRFSDHGNCGYTVENVAKFEKILL